MSLKIKNVLFICSAILLLAGTVLYITNWPISPYLFAVGAAGLTLVYITDPNKENDLRKRRLQRYNLIAGVLMIAASVLMFKNRNEWMLCLSISALLQLYVAFTLPANKQKKE